MFIPSNPPPGYVFVPSGNVFLTRRCRELAPKLYAVYRPKSRQRLAVPKGLYVPEDAFKEAESDYKAKRVRIEETLWRALDKEYPKIPLADKNELHRLISSKCPGLVGKSALHPSGIITYAYVRDRYTPFKSLTFYGERKDDEAIDRAHRRAQQILASWRGEDSSEKASR
ncbi:hypothetical protein AOQ84DRAFT_371659 [Glonium stellatum]|uniref:Uncharacterized protein n=1 Tax=Glonium stellatum TaxID=574774 RepID=A0A8E2FBN1_9PEZI|nr:hypothetical protein AOQ84DRAFT_371659 [Glonium stellatum]